MIPLPPARQARRVFIRLSAAISVLAFFVLGSTILLDQWIIGRASAGFILGTAILIAGLCTGLFAVIAAIGLMISVPLRDELGSATLRDELQALSRDERHARP